MTRVIICPGDCLYAIEVTDDPDVDLWDAIAQYDDANGTDLYDRLGPDEVLVDGGEYSDVPIITPDEIRDL